MKVGDKVRRKVEHQTHAGWSHGDDVLIIKSIEYSAVFFVGIIGGFELHRFEPAPTTLDDQIQELEEKLAALCKQKMETEYAADVKLAKDWLDSLVPYTIVAGVSYHKSGKTYRFSVTPV